MTPHQENTIVFRSSQQLPRLASCIASGTTEIQGQRQVWRARCGGPRTPSTTTDANLDCAFVENALIHTDPRL